MSRENFNYVAIANSLLKDLSVSGISLVKILEEAELEILRNREHIKKLTAENQDLFSRNEELARKIDEISESVDGLIASSL